MNPRITNSIKNGIAAFIFLAILIMVSEAWGGPPLGHGRRHPSRAFQGHHGQGFLGKGICPQNRTTVQAPDNILNKKNPIKRTYELLYKGES